jgi:aldehyde dehydrogenase (NAD+)
MIEINGQVRKLDHWINGKSYPSSSNQYKERNSPVDGRLVAKVSTGNVSDIDIAVEAAWASSKEWRNIDPFVRGRLLNKLAQAIRENAENLISIEIAETGKPIGTARGEIEVSAMYFEFYAALVHLPKGQTIDTGPYFHSYTQHEPFGVIGIITPWNVPLNQAARAAAPALAAGNTVVLKPSEVTSGTSVELARLATEVGFPNGVLNVVLGPGSIVGEALATHPLVRKLAFTGSVSTGQTIGKIAAEKIMPLTLELGGKSPTLVFEDADISKAAKAIVLGFTANAGQVCSASTRVLVDYRIHDILVEAIVKESRMVEAGVNLGPVINETQLQNIKDYFEIAMAEGAKLEIGGRDASIATPTKGNFVSATVYTAVKPRSRLAQEEIFGPVLVIIPFQSEEEAIEIANSTEYGLVAGIWTKDISRALRLVGRIDAGQVFVNTWTTGAVQTPFGGYKKSGYGREKGIEALHHYSQIKSVTIAI